MSKKESNLDTNKKPITIKKVKDSWNRQEVIELIENYSVFDDGTISTRDKWIKENL